MSRILARTLTERERDGLLAYCLLYHPHVAVPGSRKILEKAVVDATNGSVRTKNKNALANGVGSISRSPLNRDALALAVCELGAEMELLKLLGDRGPDFGLSLLIMLELLFQVAFCLRRQRETNTEALTAMSYCSRLLEIVALHLDAPPIWPRFTIKFGMTLTGLVYHRKLQSLAATRLFQLNYFVFPQLRKYLLFPGSGAEGTLDDEPNRGPTAGAPVANTAPAISSVARAVTLLDPKVEETLWQMAADLALEQPSEEVLRRVRRGERPTAIECRTDAMAVVFERLHHLSTQLFGTQLYLYGSGATGFATVNSDIDVVVHLTAEQEERLLAEARAARETQPDLNVFPALQNCGGGGTLQTGASVGASGIYPLVGDWSWLDEKNHKTAAAIWLNRKFAWACYRLYGWSVQCVQSAYVPIVRILAAVDTETAMPCELPTVFMPDYPYGSTLVSLLRQVDLEARNYEGVRYADTLENMLLLLSISRRMSLSRVKKYIARTVAYEIVSEVLYSCWGPSLSSKANFDEAKYFLLKMNGYGTDDQRLALIEENLLTLFYVYWSNLKQRADTGTFLLVNSRASSPALLPPRPNAQIDDGRLSAINGCQRDLYIVEADISVGRQVGIHNSRLLRAYAQVDSRVIALGLLVKQWARACSLEDAYNGYLSGYQWTLIVIHFLQHYCCLPVPSALESRAEWRSLISSFRHAQCGFAPQHLPILPNLQNKQTGAMPNLQHNGPLVIHEVEGDLDVWFYEPHLGNNESVDQGTMWPENTLLQTRPLLYAYTLLRAPFNLQHIASQFKATAHAAASRNQPPTSNQILSGVLERLGGAPTPVVDAAVWTMRLQSCPRPHTEQALDEESTPINNSASKTLTPHVLWDVQRSKLRERMARTWDETRRETDRNPFPALTLLRDKTFIQQHVMDRTDSMLESFRTVKGEPTLAELFFGFFEYFGTRLNYATDMIDTARAPELPRGKKEWFRTSIFDAEMDDLSGPAAQKEVAGRGNGPFQYRGRHFLCLLDPMERLRTVGPPFRCQTMITKSLAGSISALADINRMTDRKAVSASLEELFTKQPGVLPAVLRGARTPVKECLRDYIDAQLKSFSSAMTSSETQDCRVMYSGLRQMISENGNYRSLNTNNGTAPERPLPFAHQPQIGTRGVIAPAYRRHSVTNLSSPAQGSREVYPTALPTRGGSLPKTAPTLLQDAAYEGGLQSARTRLGGAREAVSPGPATARPAAKQTDDGKLLAPPAARGRCTSLPGNSLAENGLSSSGEPSGSSESSSSVEAGASVSDSGTDEKATTTAATTNTHNQRVVETFTESELSWCMRPTAFRQLQAFVRQSSAAADAAPWRARDHEDPVRWLETTTGIRRTTRYGGGGGRYSQQTTNPPPIRSIRSRQPASAQTPPGG